MSIQSVERGNLLELDRSGDAGHELAMSLRCAYLLMHRATNACFTEFGLSADSFTILITLAEHGAMTQKELAQQIGSDANTISAMLIRLERMNLIVRKRDEQDGRARIVDLTVEGRQLQETMWERSQALRLDMERLFHSREIAELTASLKRIAQAMTEKND